MEWTLDGRLLISEHTAGRVLDITDGGDMRDAESFAWGLSGPTSILPLPDGRLLVSEMWSGRIADITGGGDASTRDPFAVDLKGPYSLSRLGGSVYVVEHPKALVSQITEVIGQSERRPHVTNIPGIPLQGMEGMTPPTSWPDHWTEYFFGCNDWKTPVRIGDTDTLALNSSALGYLFKVPGEGGEFSDLVDGNDTIIATGLGHMGGMSQHPVTEQLYVTLPKEGGVISIDPTQRKDYRFEPPVIRGLNMPSCVRFSPSGDEMYVCSFAVGGVWKITGFNQEPT
jgi:glucose/arabinose dehydrogenase